MISGYYEFLFESILRTSKYFDEVIRGVDDQVAKDFFELLNKDVKTPFNALNTTDKNDKVSFISDNQFQSKINKGADPLQLFLDTNNKTSVGRLVRQILKDNGKEYTDDQIAKFVDGFKSSFEKIKSKGLEVSPIRLVSGEDIRYWYNESVYCDDTIRANKGTLGKSCMGYSECQDYLEIYVRNPSVCKLLILVKDDKLRARALLWMTNRGPYLDRTYYTDSSEASILEDWVIDNIDENSILYSTSSKLTVQLESEFKNYGEYPYMDSMVYYYTVDRKLYNYSPKVGVKRELLYVQDTDGGFERQDMIYCEYTDEELPEDEVVNSNYHCSYIPKRRAVRSEYFDDWIHEDEAKHSDYLGDYIPDDESVNVYLDEDQSDYDYFPRSHKDIAIDEDDDEYYLKSLMMEVGGSYYLKSKLIELFVVKDNSVGEYNKIFNIINSKAAVNFESDSMCSYVVKEFYKLDVYSDKNKYELKGDYYTEVYMNVDYQKMYDELYDNDDASEVIEELEEANLYLKIKYPKKYPRK